ncbi:MAG: S41 family peptidase [Ginsengibacter sp.]
MKKTFLLFFTLLQLFSFIETKAQNSADARIFQPAQMQQDFDYLRNALEKTHPGLYMHHTKEEMQYKMDSLYALLNQPKTFFEFYKIIAYLIAEVKCEHTYCNPYGGDYRQRAVQWKLIPFQLFFREGKAYMGVNRTTDTTIHLGDEILTINHYPVDSIEHVIFKYLVSDGNIESSKEVAMSNLSFNLWYYTFIEQPDAYDIEFKNAQGQTLSLHFDNNLTLAENKKLALANPANKVILEQDKKYRKLKKNPCRLEFIKDKSIAKITVTDFGGNREKLFKLYDNFFSQIQKEKPATLIIDVSYNGGGDEEYACQLLSYLIDTPTRFIESEYLINDDDSFFNISNLPADIKENKYAFIDTVTDGKIYAKALTKYSLELKTFNPQPNGFHGRVFIYVNGGTSSAASSFAGNAKSHHLATIIGNETAGCYVGGGTTNGLDLTLPNSKINAHTSIVYCKFATSGGDKDRGVIPDYYFIPTIAQQIDGKAAWEAFYNLINKINEKE